MLGICNVDAFHNPISTELTNWPCYIGYASYYETKGIYRNHRY